MKTNGMYKRLAAAALLVGLATGTAQAGIRDNAPNDGQNNRPAVIQPGDRFDPQPGHSPRVARAIDTIESFRDVGNRRELRRLAKALRVIDRHGIVDPDVLQSVNRVVIVMIRATDEKMGACRAGVPTLPESKRGSAEKLIDKADRNLEQALGLRDEAAPEAGGKLTTALRALLKVERMLDPEQQPNLDGVTFINGQRANHRRLVELEAQTNVRIDRGGRFWYDRESGAWGFEQSKAEGYIMAGLELGGEMSADVSGGQSGVLINGRELRLDEAEALGSLFIAPLPAGNYRLLDNADLLDESNGHIDNLLEAALRMGADTSFYRFTVTDPNVGPDDRTYLLGAGYSVTLER